jgi:hypothetical protein
VFLTHGLYHHCKAQQGKHYHEPKHSIVDHKPVGEEDFYANSLRVRGDLMPTRTAQELFCVLRGKIVIISTVYWGSHKLS